MSWLSELFKPKISPKQTYAIEGFTLVLMDRRDIKYKYPDGRIGSADLENRIIYVPYELRNGAAYPDEELLGHELRHLFQGHFHDSNGKDY